MKTLHDIRELGSPTGGWTAAQLINRIAGGLVMESPSDLNSVFRLLMVAERCGPEFLYDPKRTGEVLGRHRAACFNGPIFNEARRCIEARTDSVFHSGVETGQAR